MSKAITLGEILNPYDTYFANCTSSDTNLQKVCSIVQGMVNNQLQQANLSISNGDLVYSFNQGMNNVLINSCARTTTLKNVTTNANLSQSANLSFKGNAISKPAIFGLTLPIKVYFRGDFQDSLGASVLVPSYNPFSGPKYKCVAVGTDSYYGDVTTSATATITAMLSLEPRYAVSSSNHLVVQLKPITDVSATVNNLQLNLQLHGVSPFANMFSLLTAPINAVNGQVEAISDGGNIKSIIASQTYAAVMSIASTTYGGLLTDYALGNPLQIDSFVNAYLQNKAAQIAANKATTFGDDVSSRLKSRIKTALNLDANGKVIYAYDHNFNQVPVTQADKDAIAALEIASIRQLPVYRFYSPSRHHLLTLNKDEGIANGFAYEQIAFKVHSDALDSNMIQIYRCYNAGGDDHFVSTKATCEGYKFEGAYGWISSADRAGFTPLYRFYSGHSDHLATTNYAEGVNAGWIYEGILGYVLSDRVTTGGTPSRPSSL